MRRISWAGVSKLTAALKYQDMTLTELASLDKRNVVIFMPVSPIEVHGPHLPVGTDVFVGQEVGRRVLTRIRETHPAVTCVELPPLYCGSDAVPAAGSLSVSQGALASVLYDYSKGLARQGFKYLVLLDNHGGPRHHLAISAAARRAWTKHGFYLLCPFIEVFKRMVRHDPELLSMTGLAPGTCGDDEDSHAGANETSLYLAIRNGEAGPFTGVAESVMPAPSGLSRLVDSLGALMQRLGASETGPDLRHLAKMLAWTGTKGFTPYMGAPSLASAEAGEAMLRAHVFFTERLLDEALSGKPVRQRPMLSALSFLRYLPE